MSGNDIPYRYKIPLENIEDIIVMIEVYQKQIAFYERYLEKHGSYSYVDERIAFLTNKSCEYLIAKEYAREGAKAFGSEVDTYSASEKEFKAHFPKLAFTPPRESND